ncbi:MAG: hypothetical protein KatS3mg102_1228 [Planctomycetota bacterium]|nr:MAG: hypothetical protein KatS3mg102_1228 [Planctomycetota bacterium]
MSAGASRGGGRQGQRRREVRAARERARLRRGVLAVLVAAPVLAASPAAGTNAAAPLAVHAKAAGRAGAQLAVGESALSVSSNPASIIELPRLRLDGSLGWLITRSRFQNDLNDRLSTSFDTVTGAGGVVWDPASDPDDPWGPGSEVRLGFAIFVPVGGGGSSELKTPVFPEGETEASTFFFLTAMPSIAVRVHPKLAIGFGLNLIWLRLETEGLVGSNDNSGGLVFRYFTPEGQPIQPPEPVLVEGQQVTWQEVFDLADTEDANESSRIEVTDVNGFGIGAHVGLVWRPLPELSFGLSYRTPGFVPKASGRARLDASRAIEALRADPQLQAILQGLLEAHLPNRGARGFRARYDFEIERFDMPAVLAGGLAWRPSADWLIALDLRYIFWSDAFGEEEVTLRNGTNDDINEINGSDRLRDKKLLRWDDQFTVALGTAWRIPQLSEELVFRLGYNYGNNPQPASTFTANTGILEHHLSVGLGWMHGAWDFDLAYVYGFPNEIRVRRSDAGRAYDDSAASAEQHFLHFGIGYQF